MCPFNTIINTEGVHCVHVIQYIYPDIPLYLLHLFLPQPGRFWYAGRRLMSAVPKQVCIRTNVVLPVPLLFHISVLTVHVTCVIPCHPACHMYLLTYLSLPVTPICHCVYFSSDSYCHQSYVCVVTVIVSVTFTVKPGDISSASRRVVVHGTQWQRCEGGRL